MAAVTYLVDPRELPIPDGFERSATTKAWQGKIRCLSCTATGWPAWPSTDSDYIRNRWWGRKHGLNCDKRPCLEEAL